MTTASIAEEAGVAVCCAQGAEVIGRAAPLFEVMRAASADPEVGEILAHNQRLSRTDIYSWSANTSGRPIAGSPGSPVPA